MADSDNSASLTTLGTLNYSAPEIRANLEKNEDGKVSVKNITSKYTESCDIFSAALVACQLANGKVDKGKKSQVISLHKT